MLERWQIEGRSAQEIAADMRSAFDKFCSSTGSAGSGTASAATSAA
jgi:hypothetical protein